MTSTKIASFSCVVISTLMVMCLMGVSHAQTHCQSGAPDNCLVVQGSALGVAGNSSANNGAKVELTGWVQLKAGKYKCFTYRVIDGEFICGKVSYKPNGNQALSLSSGTYCTPNNKEITLINFCNAACVSVVPQIVVSTTDVCEGSSAVQYGATPPSALHKWYKWYLNGAEVSPTYQGMEQYYVTPSDLAVGVYNITVVATDNCGHTEASSASLAVVATPQIAVGLSHATSPIVIPTGDVLQVNWTITDADNSYGVSHYHDDALVAHVETTSGSYSYVLVDGAHTITVTANASSGCVATKSYQFIAQNVSGVPTLTLTWVPPLPAPQTVYMGTSYKLYWNATNVAPTDEAYQRLTEVGHPWPGPWPLGQGDSWDFYVGYYEYVHKVNFGIHSSTTGLTLEFAYDLNVLFHP